MARVEAAGGASWRQEGMRRRGLLRLLRVRLHSLSKISLHKQVKGGDGPRACGGGTGGGLCTLGGAEIPALG